MSAEGKKKRGISGAANGKSIPFRYTGGGVHPKHLATTMHQIGGLSEKVGRPRDGSAYDKTPQGLSYAEACAREKHG